MDSSIDEDGKIGKRRSSQRSSSGSSGSRSSLGSDSSAKNKAGRRQVSEPTDQVAHSSRPDQVPVAAAQGHILPGIFATAAPNFAGGRSNGPSGSKQESSILKDEQPQAIEIHVAASETPTSAKEAPTTIGLPSWSNLSAEEDSQLLAQMHEMRPPLENTARAENHLLQAWAGISTKEQPTSTPHPEDIYQSGWRGSNTHSSSRQSGSSGSLPEGEPTSKQQPEDICPPSMWRSSMRSESRLSGTSAKVPGDDQTPSSSKRKGSDDILKAPTPTLPKRTLNHRKSPRTNSKPQRVMLQSSRRSSPIQTSGRNRQLSMSSLIQGLKTFTDEHHGEQCSKGLTSLGDVLPAIGESLKSQDIRKVALFVAALAVLVVVVIVIAGIALKGPNIPVPPKPFCKTKDCVFHAWRLSAKLNHSLDPCRNFSAYVCSAWSPPERYLEHSNSAMDDVRKSWFPAFQRMLADGARIINAGRKPLAMYASCMGDQSQYGSNVAIFWRFLDECQLSWPGERDPGDTKALDVLLTLAFKWHVPLFFQVRLLRVVSPMKWRFVIDPGPLIPLMFQHHTTIKQAGGYVKYWSTFYAILKGVQDEAEKDKKLIEATMAIEGDVFKKLLTAMQPAVVQPVLVSITQMGYYTQPLTSDQWLKAFKLTQLEPAVRPVDEVLLGDVPFFKVLASVLTAYTDSQLLALIGWSFVQLFSPAVDFRLLQNRYGLGVALYRPYFCERLVEAAYPLLVTALGSVSRFSREERTFVTTGFESLVSAAAGMLAEATWLDEGSRSLAVRKVSSTRLVLWPPERFLKSSELERLYNDFPTEEASFGEYWVKASRSAAAAYRPREDIDPLGYPVNYALPYFLYDAVTGSVKVAVGAVTTPLYYSKGTKAMFYGGLGFYMALRLVASIDNQRLRWHPDGSFGDFFLSNGSAAMACGFWNDVLESNPCCSVTIEKRYIRLHPNNNFKILKLSRAHPLRYSIAHTRLEPIVCDRADRSASLKAFETKDACLDVKEQGAGNETGTESKQGDSIFPEVPALEVAHKAYHHSVRADDAPQGISSSLTGEQVFFMTLCYMTCTLPGVVGPHTVDCNKAVRNSAAFAEAFQCPAGSPMNPKKKCSFFA